MRIDRLIAKAISDCHFLGGVRVPAIAQCYGTHARSHARWGGDTIPPTRPTLLDRGVKVQKYSDTVL